MSGANYLIICVENDALHHTCRRRGVYLPPGGIFLILGRKGELENKVILVGRLTQDPEVRYTANGKVVATFTVAVNRRVNGEEAAGFIPVVVWKKFAEICGNNLTKGRRVFVEGRLQIRSYEKESSEKRWFRQYLYQCRAAFLVVNNFVPLSSSRFAAGKEKRSLR